MEVPIQFFIELIQTSLGDRECLDCFPNASEWEQLFDLAEKQALVGVTTVGIDKVMISYPNEVVPNILYQWLGEAIRIEHRNAHQDQCSRQVYDFFKTEGFRSCILKGQGIALYYSSPKLRQSGDIDIWVDGSINDVLQCLADNGIEVTHTTMKDSSARFYKDIPVEIHHRTNFFYNNKRDKKWELWESQMRNAQFENYDEICGFAHPTIEFNLVYVLTHIYRHLFTEGIGMRQLVDYYYLVLSSSKKARKACATVIESLGIKSFAGGVMYILQLFGLNEEFMIVLPNRKYGDYLLNQILGWGNFGVSNPLHNSLKSRNLFIRSYAQFRHNVDNFIYNPIELMSAPIWKVKHRIWRKKNGYLHRI